MNTSIYRGLGFRWPEMLFGTRSRRRCEESEHLKIKGERDPAVPDGYIRR